MYDQQSAVVPGVRITVTNTATQVERTAATDHEGSFQIMLPNGALLLQRRNATDFRSVISAEQKLSINQALRIDIKMKSEPRVRR